MPSNRRFLAKNGLDNANQTIINLLDPIGNQDAATKNYVDLGLSSKISGISPSLSGTIKINGDTSGKTLGIIGNGVYLSPSTNTLNSTEGFVFNSFASFTNWQSMYAFKSLVDGIATFYVDGRGNIGCSSITSVGDITNSVTVAGASRQLMTRNHSNNASAYTIFDMGNDVGGAEFEIALTSSNNNSYGVAAYGGAIIHTNKGLQIGTTSAYPLALKTNGVDRLTINSAGNITVTGVITSNVALGTAPFSILSSTLCTNLNSNYVNGYGTSTTATGNSVAIRDSSGNLNVNYLNTPANDIGQTIASRVAVDINSDSYIRWQSITNLSTTINRSSVGNHVSVANNGRLSINKTYTFYSSTYGGSATWYLPSRANSYVGDEITVVAMDWTNNGGWQTSTTLTIACDADVRIGKLNIGESLILDDDRVHVIKFICTWSDAANCQWAYF